MLISVVVPMMNEEGSLPHLARELDGLRHALAARGDRLEVVLVDDGSTDSTADAARALCAQRDAWSLVRHATNRGFGAGLRTGVAAAVGDVLVSYDADCAYPALDIVPMLETLETGVDVVSATPFAAGGSANESAWRLLLSRGCSGAYRLVLGRRARGLHTFTCAFRVYRADVLRRSGWRADGFLAAAEILSRCLLGGARVTQQASTLRPRVAGVSKMRVVRTGFAHLGLLARLAGARLVGRTAPAPVVVPAGEAA